MTLTEFLLARIAEREDMARRARAAFGGYVPEMWDLEVARGLAEDGAPTAVVVQVAQAEPSGVLTECEAQRRIVELCAPGDFSDPRHHPTGDPGEDDRHDVLAIMATAYANHPDYPLRV